MSAIVQLPHLLITRSDQKDLTKVDAVVGDIDYCVLSREGDNGLTWASDVNMHQACFIRRSVRDQRIPEFCFFLFSAC